MHGTAGAGVTSALVGIGGTNFGCVTLRALLPEVFLDVDVQHRDVGGADA